MTLAKVFSAENWPDLIDVQMTLTKVLKRLSFSKAIILHQSLMYM
jgi:hypothetical protein